MKPYWYSDVVHDVVPVEQVHVTAALRLPTIVGRLGEVGHVVEAERGSSRVRGGVVGRGGWLRRVVVGLHVVAAGVVSWWCRRSSSRGWWRCCRRRPSARGRFRWRGPSTGSLFGVGHHQVLGDRGHGQHRWGGAAAGMTRRWVRGRGRWGPRLGGVRFSRCTVQLSWPRACRWRHLPGCSASRPRPARPR